MLPRTHLASAMSGTRFSGIAVAAANRRALVNQEREAAHRDAAHVKTLNAKEEALLASIRNQLLGGGKKTSGGGGAPGVASAKHRASSTGSGSEKPKSKTGSKAKRVTEDGVKQYDDLDDLEDDVRSREGETFDAEDETSGNARTHPARHESRDTNRGAPLFVVPPADVSVAASVVAATRAPHANSVAALERRGVVRDQPRDAPRDVTTVRPALADDAFARFWSRQWERSTLENVASGVFPARDSYLTMTGAQYDAHDHFAYDQYEVCVPMRRAGACLRALARGARDGATGDVGGDAFGFRSQALIRFINEEDALLSPANGRAAGACMYVNIEDFVKYNRGGTNASSTETTTEKDEPSQKTPSEKNEPFLRVVRLLRSETCRGRLHWGKAGWPTHTPCFDGAEDYPETWCDFGCAVVELDPDGKFRSESDVWRWAASRAGEAVQDFGSCCTSAGFSSQCVCERSPIC